MSLSEITAKDRLSEFETTSVLRNISEANNDLECEFAKLQRVSITRPLTALLKAPIYRQLHHLVFISTHLSDILTWINWYTAHSFQSKNAPYSYFPNDISRHRKSSDSSIWVWKVSELLFRHLTYMHWPDRKLLVREADAEASDWYLIVCYVC